MRKFYTIKIEAKEGSHDQLDQPILQQEVASLERLFQLLRDSTCCPDADGTLNYLAGYEWFRSHHGLKPKDIVSFSVLRTVFNTGDRDGRPTWQLVYVLDGVEWVMSLSIHSRAEDPVDVTIQDLEA